MRSVRTGLTVMVAVGIIALGACGSESTDRSDTSPTTSPSATQAGGDSDRSHPQPERHAPLDREAFATCGDSQGFRLSDGVRGILGSVERRADLAKTIDFSDEKFGAAVRNASLLIFDEPDATTRSLIDLRDALGRKRRIIRRDDALIVLGTKANREALDALVKCAKQE